MVRRSLGVALWIVAGLLACFLGALAALVGTSAGRRMLGRVTERVVTRALDGSLEIGDVSGTLLTGLTVTDLRLFDPDSTLVAWFPRAELGYNPLDFAAGRIVLLELHLTRPFFNVEEGASGALNVEKLLRLGEPDTAPSQGPPPLILFRDVRIDDGTLVLRLRHGGAPIPEDSLREFEILDANGRRRIRRFEGLEARFPAVRISAPRERGIRFDVERLAFRGSDPAVTVTDARGRITVSGPELELRLERLSLPASELRLAGWLRWPRDTVLYELDVTAERATLTDFRWLDARFPGGILRGGVELRSSRGRRLDVRLDPLRLTFAGGTLEGRVTAESDARDGLVAVRDGELDARDFDLEFVRPFLDTLPFAGRLTGRTVLDGPLTALALEVEWVFRDSLALGQPANRVRGRGQVDLADPAGLAFEPLAVEAAEIDLATVRRLVPALAVQGVLDAAGTVTGPYTNAQFSGTLRHRHGDLPVSVVRGVLRLDTRADPLGVWVDVLADTLSFETLRASYPRLPLRGSAAGTVRLGGDLAALDADIDLAAVGAERGGRVRFEGEVALRPERVAARDFTLTLADADLATWLAGPPSRLAARVAGDVTADSGTAPSGRLTVALAPSLFAGMVLDTGVTRLHFGDHLLHVDTLLVRQPGLRTAAAGAIGWDRTADGTLTLELDADSLRALDSLIAWAAGIRLDPERPLEGLGGGTRLRVRLTGSLDSADVNGEADLEGVRWRGWAVPSGTVRVAFTPGVRPQFSAEARLDSLGSANYAFGGVVARAQGTPDSLTWFARARVGELAAFLAGGRLARGGTEPVASGPAADPAPAPDSTAIAVGIDSLAVLMAGGVWVLDRPLELIASDSLIRVGELVLTAARGPGRLVLRGALPTRGRADANLHLESFPLAGLYSLLQRDTLGVGGVVTASVALVGTRAEPHYRGSFALSEGSLGRFRIPYLDGTLEYRDRQLDAAAHLWRSGQQILNLHAHLPLDLALADVPRRLPDTLSVSATADSVDLAVLEALTPLVRQVRGGFSADVGIRGTWDAPSLRGAVHITNAEAFIPAVNVRYEGVSSRLTLSGDTIRVDSLVARGGDGRARITGYVRLEGLTEPTLGLTITADRFRALDLRNHLSVTASGNLALSGPVFGAALTGQGTVTSGVLHFADLVQKRVINLDAPWVATLIDTSLAATIRRERLSPEFQSVFLDSLRIRGLRLAMGSDVWLRSTEANIQLAGAVEVTKTGSDYLLTGTLEAPRGTYRLELGQVVSREFVVTGGTVRYFGTPDLNAALDITARHVVYPLPSPSGVVDEEITVIAHIRGTLLAPELVLEAEGRDLSQSEIISYLMFGRRSVELGQQALLQSAVARVVGELERTIVSDLGVPLDYLEIRPGTVRPGAGDPFAGTRLAAGWQIGRKTFLVLNAGSLACPEQTATVIGASLQFRISPEWRTEASFEPLRACAGGVPSARAAETPQIGLDLFWERRY